MAQQAKTGGGVGLLVLIAVVVVVGATLVKGGNGPRLDPQTDNTERVSLVVEATPSSRLLAIQITVTVEGVVIIDELQREFPWTREPRIPKGAELVMVVIQPGEGEIKCLINGKLKDSSDRSGTSGSLVCVHNG